MKLSLPLIRTLFDSVGPNPWVVRCAFKSKNIRLLDGKALLSAATDSPLPYVERYTLKLVNGFPENRLPKMTEKNPAGTTPFIELEDGTYLSETVAICEYLDLLYPDVGPLLTGGPNSVDKCTTSMWTQRIQLGITQPFQRQFQYGEGAPYFKHHVPWVEASIPALPGLRKQTYDTLEWLEETMQKRRTVGKDTGFIAGTESYTVSDLHLYCTAKFMSSPKVNVQKLTDSFDPANTHFGPWLQEWYQNMDHLVKALDQ
jgi:glutathione S-transferase